MFKAICMGSLLVVGAAHADVGREESLDAAVRQFAAKLEADWQQCLRKPETKTTQDSGLCAYAMREAAKDAVNEKYQKKLAGVQEDADKGWLPKDVPAMLPQAQASWEQFVKADCGVVGALTTGTASATYQTVCEYKHQIQRLRDLDEW
ncbi:lysozyme inhibitor LprI family protein [Pseudomonas oryzicola]|nr:lysozyme inhibitor LprI family protein [Pseudomonas oryzicola]